MLGRVTIAPMQPRPLAETVVLQRKIKARAKARKVWLGRLIAEERARQGFSQHTLAKAVDCPDDMIGHFESGRSNYWKKLREIIEVLAPHAGKLWLKQTTNILKGQVIIQIEEEPDAIRRLMLAEWLRSSGDRATATSTDTVEEYLPGFVALLKEPERHPSRVA